MASALESDWRVCGGGHGFEALQLKARSRTQVRFSGEWRGCVAAFLVIVLLKAICPSASWGLDVLRFGRRVVRWTRLDDRSVPACRT